jgi:phosphoribosylformylglycinamidine synthase PurS subunit
LKVKVKIVLKDGILDPQGKAVLNAIHDLKHQSVEEVRIGKYVELTFDHKDKSFVEKEAREICDKILSNPVMENFDFEIEE